MLLALAVSLSVGSRTISPSSPGEAFHCRWPDSEIEIRLANGGHVEKMPVAKGDPCVPIPTTPWMGVRKRPACPVREEQFVPGVPDRLNCPDRAR